MAWPFLWDDFDFLHRVAAFQWSTLLPKAGAALYRPISQEAYFGLIEHALGLSPLSAHLLNLALAASCLLVLASFLRRRVGPRGAVLGGLLLASVASLPLLIGWASGGQDLLCILFLVTAFNFADTGKTYRAIAAFGAALLSKETAVVLAPVLLLLSPGREQDEGVRTRRLGTGLVLLGIVWVLAHPWTRRLLGLSRPDVHATYVMFQGVDAVRYAYRGVLNLLNLTWSLHLEWRTDVIVTALLGSAVILSAVAAAWRVSSPSTTAAPSPSGVSYRLSACLTMVAPLFLTSLLIGHWSPYYACLPAVGLSMLAAPWIARQSRGAATAVCLLFLWLGVGSRLATVEPEVHAESNMRVTAEALDRVEQGFRALRPSLPPGARVYVYVQARGAHGIYASLYKDQPLRVWYQDPAIEVLDPYRLAHGSSDDLLFWIGPTLNVYEVNVGTLRAKTSGPPVPFDEYQKTLRAYAMGLAGDGQVDRAVEVLTRMHQYSEELRAFDRRSAAMLLYAAGRAGEADRLLDGTMRFRRASAIELVEGLVAKPVGTLDLGPAAMKAFDFDPADTAVVRQVMRWLVAHHYDESARQFARRLAVLAPGDLEAERVARGRE